MYHEDEILAVLPPNLRAEIMSFNHRQLFDSVPLLSLSSEKSPKAFIERLAPVLTPRLVFSGETIFEEEMTGMEMYFVLSGIVQILSKFCEPVVKAIADGCYFGDVACLIGCKRTATTKARTNTVLNVLRKQDLLELLTDFPEVLG
jgi:hyperpolarization activated cyclic nucleotide-gated potassium channel 1